MSDPRDNADGSRSTPVMLYYNGQPVNLGPPIASATTLGVIRAGAGLTIDPLTGIASVTGGGGGGGVSIGTTSGTARDAALAISAESAAMAAAAAAQTTASAAATATALTAEISRAQAAEALALPKSGGTLTGPVIAAADPTTPLGLATKQYVDGHSSAYTLPAATSSVLGGVKQGANITIASDGTISATGSSTSVDASAATGTTQAAAAVITAQITIMTSVAAGAGRTLPVGPGSYRILNRGANAGSIWPPAGVSAQIETFGANNAATIPAGGSATLTSGDGVQWYAS